jgi:hypothetical protein
MNISRARRLALGFLLAGMAITAVPAQALASGSGAGIQGCSIRNLTVSNDFRGYEGTNPGGSPTPFTFMVTPSSGECPISLRWESVNNNQDYFLTSGGMTWNAFDTTPKFVTVNVIPDADAEPNETFSLKLTPELNGPIMRFDHNPAFATIRDDDGPVKWNVNSTSCTENGNPLTNPTTDCAFTVSRSVSVNETTTVDFQTMDATASSPGDYHAAAGTLTIGPWGGVVTGHVAITNDFNCEPIPKEFTVRLSNPTAGSVVADEMGIITIYDDLDCEVG